VRDGTLLFADVYRPTGGGKFPVLLMRLPYNKNEAQHNLGYAHPVWYAKKGYMVVVQDVRGRWASEGTFYPFLHEGEDSYDTIEWAAGLAGSNGRVGTYGFSYAGATQLLGARLNPPSLITMCPAFTPSQYYEGHCFHQGAFSLAFAASWAIHLAQEEARRQGDEEALISLQDTFRHAHEWYWKMPWKSFPPFLKKYAPYFFDWLEHSTYDAYWRRWSIDEDYGNIQVPALHIGGWYDLFIRGTIRNFVGFRGHGGGKSIGSPQKLLVGPWYHMPWHPLTGEREQNWGASVIDDWQIAWFDHFLKEKKSTIFDYPVRVFVIGDGWRDLDDWPPTSCRLTGYFLHSEGRANTRFGHGILSTDSPGEESPDTYIYSPMAPNISAGGHSGCSAFVAPMGPADQETFETSRGVLVYTTPPLDHDVEIIGDVWVTLYASSTAADTDFTARLCLVDTGGSSMNLQEGIVRARFRNSTTHPILINPGKVYKYRICLGPVCARIREGEKIRLCIGSSDFPQWDRNFNKGRSPGPERLMEGISATQMVYHTARFPSKVVLPITDA